uniref:Uncharacterized protein n=1 Tax=Arundo donax TaxID=35708 RepID=A0A0A9GBR5_ARUDO
MGEINRSELEHRMSKININTNLQQNRRDLQHISTTLIDFVLAGSTVQLATKLIYFTLAVHLDIAI